MNIMPLTSPEQITQLKPWLESFDHKTPIEPVGKFHLFTKGERVLALTQQVQINALFPAINPHIVTPRETHEIGRCFHAWTVNTLGGLSVSVPSGSHMHKFMEKLGYRPSSVLYEPIIEPSPQQ